MKQMTNRIPRLWSVTLIALCWGALQSVAQDMAITVSIDRGKDVGQAFGSLFECASADGSVTVGAGFQNAYNTRYRADRHAVQFFVRPTDGSRSATVEELPRPTDDLTGAYLHGRDGVVYSTYGGLKSWNAGARRWDPATGPGGKEETMRVGDGTLGFGSSRVTWNGEVVLKPPAVGSYQLFFYTNGHLCFYHVNRGDKPYRPYVNDEDGFSRLFACPWKPSEGRVDLSKAIAFQLPIVGETTFAWGTLGKQIVTGSNIGGFYVFEDGKWRMILEPVQGVSFQLYSSVAFHGRLLMGQYPTGRVFEYDGAKLVDREGWPPFMNGVSRRAREAQTTVVYGGEVMVGVWPWGEVWRYNPGGRRWRPARRMFRHPELSATITHPYDVENRNNAPRNQWGQRVTSLIPCGPDLFISTSAKSPQKWNAERFPFLADGRWKSYGKVYRLNMPGHLAAPTRWTRGQTTLVFTVGSREMSIRQDGRLLAKSPFDEQLAAQLSRAGEFKDVQWGDGVYGEFGGVSLTGRIRTRGD